MFIVQNTEKSQPSTYVVHPKQVQRSPGSSFPPLKWIQSHHCWRDKPETNGWDWAQNLGQLSELRERSRCQLCQQIYQLLNAQKWVTGESDESEIRCEITYHLGRKLHFHFTWPGKSSILSHVTLRPVGRYQNGASILDQSVISIDEMKKWLAVCDFSHSKCFPSNNNDSPKLTVLFIDTKKECLAESSLVVPFLVLSYVWGGKDSFQTLRANLDLLQSPGSLRKHWERIPATIRDAIILTSKLGYQFLWVDQLCIVQDDAENKAKHIQRMDSIYSHASITIVAADGVHSEHGLRGVESCSLRMQTPQEILDLSPHGKFVVAPDEYIPDQLYYTRGWTYQEYHLSNRMLVFMDNKVIWKCREFECQEGLTTPVDGYGLLEEPAMQEPPDYPSLSYYSSLVEGYNKRNLGLDSDILPAFTGILGRLNSVFDAGFLQGLPELFFDIALLWQPANVLRRRTGDAHHAPPPSWSWVAWHGEIDLDLWDLGLPGPGTGGVKPNEYTSSTSPVTSWFKMNSHSGNSHPIDNSYYRYYHYRVPSYPNILYPDPLEPDFIARFSLPVLLPASEKLLESNEKLWLSGWKLSTCDYGNKREKDPTPSKGTSIYDAWVAQLKLSRGGIDPTQNDHTKKYHGSWPCYSHEALKGSFSYPLPIGKPPKPLQSPDFRFLRFRTSRAFFYTGRAVIRQEENKPTPCVSVTITDKHGELAGVLRLNTTVKPNNRRYQCELVAISKGRAHLRTISPRLILEEASDLECLMRIAQVRAVSPDHTSFVHDPLEPKDMEHFIRNCIGMYEWYNVLWIWWKDGVAYRNALGRVFKEVWENQDLEETDVILG